MHRFLIVIENAGRNFSAYSPDLPGCVATGATVEETERRMYEAIQLHLEGMREDGEPIPKSSAFAEYVAVPAPGIGTRAPNPALQRTRQKRRAAEL